MAVVVLIHSNTVLYIPKKILFSGKIFASLCFGIYSFTVNNCSCTTKSCTVVFLWTLFGTDACVLYLSAIILML